MSSSPSSSVSLFINSFITIHPPTSPHLMSSYCGPALPRPGGVAVGGEAGRSLEGSLGDGKGDRHMMGQSMKVKR